MNFKRLVTWLEERCRKQMYEELYSKTFKANVVLELERKKLQMQVQETTDALSKLAFQHRDCVHQIHQLNRQYHDLQEQYDQLKKRATLLDRCPTLSQVRQAWLSQWITRLNESTYGAGQFYELYEECKQQAVGRFLADNSACLTVEEIQQFKQATDYQENFEPYTEMDEATGQVLNTYTLAQRLQHGEYN